MNKISKIVLLLIINLLIFIIFFIFLEFLIRIFMNENSRLWNITNEANILRNFKYKYTNEFYGQQINETFYQRDHYGLRDDCEDPSKIDILTIGGSTTDQRYINLEDTYQSVLAEKLSDFLDKDICISNAGVDGHSTYGHIFSFKNWFSLIPNLKPKYVLLYIGINDADFSRVVGPADGFDNTNNNNIKSYLKEFYIIQELRPIYRYFLDKIIKNNKIYGVHQKEKIKISDYSALDLSPSSRILSEKNALKFKTRLKKILIEIEKMDANYLCVTQPHNMIMNINNKRKGLKKAFGEDFNGLDFDYSLQSLNEVIYELCGKSTIDLYKKGLDKKYFYDSVHTSKEGSILLGKLIFDEILADDHLKEDIISNLKNLN